MKEVEQANCDRDLSFDELFYKYHTKLYYYVLNKTKSTYCAEEVVQLTFIKLWKCRGTLRSDVPVAIQIFRIAKTTLIDHLRKEDVSERLMMALKLVHASEAALPTHESLIEKETMKQILSLVSEMPPMRRKVFELSRFNGYSYKQIASMLFISVKTVENHINHALKIIKTHLGTIALFVLHLVKF